MTRNRIFSILLVAIISFNWLAIFVPNAQAAGASLYLTPSTGTFVIGSTFKVGVKVNSGGEAINAAEGSISYDKDLLEVASLSKGSIFMFWTTEPSSGGGMIKFGGGNPTSYTGAAGGILTITFKAKKAGTAQVRFVSGAVLANDGKGTNILASMGSGSYTVSPNVEAPKAETPTKPAVNEPTDKPAEKPKAEEDEPTESEYNKPTIKSISHPDQNTWYQNSDVKFSWDLPSGVSGVSVSLDRQPVADPGPESDGLLSEKEYPITEGGIWYLHLKFKDNKKWGTVSHYRVMIDKNPPITFTVKVGNTVMGTWPILEFEAKDVESGLDRYELFVGSLEHQAHKLEADKKSIELAYLEPGSHTVLLKAIDKAGNQRVETAEFVIEPIPTPEISDFPREVKPSDKFYLSGSAVENSQVDLYFEKDEKFLASTTVKADANGNWSYIHDKTLDEGRYAVFAEALNDKGMRSRPSAKANFMVTPPVFAIVGSFILDYFTVIVSLIFMTLLTILVIFLIVYFVKNKLKKEAVEVEDVLKRNLGSFRKEMEDEFKAIIEKETRVSGRKNKLEVKNKLIDSLNAAEKKIMKEVRDVEDILK